MRPAFVILATLALGCDAYQLPSRLSMRAVTKTVAGSPAVFTPLAPLQRVSPLSMMAAKKPVKKPVKKPLKKPVKKPVKKVVAKKPVKRVVKKGLRKKGLKEGQVGLLGGRALREEIPFFLTQASTAAKDYGGGNGQVLFSPTFIAAAAAWVFIVLRYTIFYGF